MKIQPRRDSMSRQTNADNDSHLSTPRRVSGEMMSIKEFLSANKVTLALMEKQLYETAQMHRGGRIPSPIATHHQNKALGPGSPGAVGPLQIASAKFQDSNNMNN